MEQGVIDVLNKGLLFVPTKNFFPRDTFIQSLKKLEKNITLTTFFQGRPITSNNRAFQAPSSFVPPILFDNTKDTIKRLNLITKKILDEQSLDTDNNIKIFHESNLTDTERVTLRKLSKDDSIIIKPSDKGGSIVVMGKQYYIDECLRQLGDQNYYKKLDNPIYIDNIKPINNILKELVKEKYLTDAQFEFLCSKTDCRPRIFYILPKVHKEVGSWPSPYMPPGRPIVSDCSSESYLVSQYIDSFLTPLSNKHPSYLKDTTDFLLKVTNKPIPENVLLVTGDVTSLYTNMNLNRTLASVKRIFSTYPDPTRPDKYLLQLLDITLKNNDFVFNNQVYVQTCGIAMGKKYAPSLANIYLINFDLVLAGGFEGIVPIFPFRFLDDIFFLWGGTTEQLFKFQNYLNTIIPGIKITFNFNREHIDFLDTTIYKCKLTSSTVLHSRVFFKPTDNHQLLHMKSFHPPHTFLGILKSQFLRFKRLSSTQVDYELVCQILIKSLSERGYTVRTFNKLKNEIWPPFRTLNLQWKGDLPLARSEPCGIRKCLTCLTIQNKDTFESSTYNKTYPILTNCNCNSRNLIYLITCSLCEKQYVGETGNPLRNRLNNHRSDIKTKKPTSVALHFNLEGHSYKNLQIIPIEILNPNQNSIEYRRAREFHWQKTLGTIFPLGLNNYPIDPKTPLLFHLNNPPPKKLIPIVLPFCSLSARLAHEWKQICGQDRMLCDCRFLTAYKNGSNIKKFLVRSKL